MTLTPRRHNTRCVFVPECVREDGGFFSISTHARTYLGSEGRNHANIADADVASQIVTWILQVERDRGDL